MKAKILSNNLQFHYAFSEKHQDWVEDFEGHLEENLRTGEISGDLETLVLTYHAHVNYWMNGYGENTEILETLISYGYEEESFNLPSFSGPGVIIPEGVIKINHVEPMQVVGAMDNGDQIMFDAEAGLQLFGLETTVFLAIEEGTELTIDDTISHYFFTEEAYQEFEATYLDAIADLNDIYAGQNFEQRIIPGSQELTDPQ